MFIDVAKSQAGNIVALIKAQNPDIAHVADGDFTFELPAVLTNDPDGYNTEVTFTVANYSRDRTIKYNRLNMLTGVETIPVNITVDVGDTLAQVRDKVATAMGLVSTAIKIDAITMPPSTLVNGLVTISPVNGADSLLYLNLQEVFVLKRTA